MTVEWRSIKRFVLMRTFPCVLHGDGCGHALGVWIVMSWQGTLESHNGFLWWVCCCTAGCCAARYQINGREFMPLTECPGTCQTNGSAGQLHMQTRGSKFVKFQEVRVQELPEQVPIGNIPRSMTCIARGEMCRKASPGDIVTIAGVFLPTPYTVRCPLSLPCLPLCLPPVSPVSAVKCP